MFSPRKALPSVAGFVASKNGIDPYALASTVPVLIIALGAHSKKGFASAEVVRNFQPMLSRAVPLKEEHSYEIPCVGSVLLIASKLRVQG